MGADHSSWLSGRALTTNAFWSLAAQVVPAAVGVATIPFIVRGLGVERFGVLTLAWMVIGYFSLLDLGMGRAVTKLAAELLVSADRPRINRFVWTAWYLMLAVGLVGAVVLTALVPWLVGTAIRVPAYLHRETLQSFYILAWSIPVVVLTTGFRGLLEAAQRFKLTSLIRIPMGILTFVTPLLVLPFTDNLGAILLALMVVRCAGAAAYAVMCHRVVQLTTKPPALDRPAARMLLRSGAWMTVSNVLSPLMVSVDRFFVGALVSLTAVAYYATPFEAVTKFLIIPSAIAAVLFPAFSSAAVVDQARTIELFRKGVRAVFLSMYPIAFVVIAFAPDLLRAWLGDAFAQESAGVLRWLTLGVLMNSLASLPFALLQGVGRSDTTARVHLAEAPIYLTLMLALIQRYGATGAAIAWCARTTLDMILLFWFAVRHLRPATSNLLRDLAILAVCMPVLGVGLLVRSPLLKGLLSTILVIAFVILVWNWLLTSRAARPRSATPTNG